MSSEPGTKFDRYVLKELLGSGGMGKVYRAFDTRLHRFVALKILEPAVVEGVDEAVATGLREARAAAAVHHPNVTAIFDADRLDEVSFIVMELVPGRSLFDLVGSDRVDVPTRIRWLADVARGLAAAHALGVVHRDIKPANVIVRDDGLVKVLDFGIARLPTSTSTSASTYETPRTLTGGGLVGTPAYMAPEQIRGHSVDGRADQFSWGVLAYELLTGSLPWKRTSPFEMLASVMRDAPLPFPAAPVVPAEVQEVVLRALAKAPADRFASMDEVVDALAPVIAAAPPVVVAAPPSSGSGLRATIARSTPTELIAAPASEERVARPPPPPESPRIAEPPPAVIEPPPASSEPPARGSPAPAPPTQRAPSLPPPPPAAPLVFRYPNFSAPVDLDAHLAALPRDAGCKGMFFTDLLKLGANAGSPDELARRAGIPVRRYVAFRDYPMSEHLRLLALVARLIHRGFPLGEGLRRIGHTAFTTLLESHVGKTLFSAFGSDVELVLASAPKAFKLVNSGGEFTGSLLGPATYVHTVRGFPCFLETYHAGVIEGMLRHLGARGRLLIATDGLANATFELTLA